MKSVIAIVVNYNSGSWLAQCVQSILHSEHPVDVYVVDNKSSDDSLVAIQSLAKQHNNLHLIKNNENQGFAKANNIVLNTTNADYYVLINPDCMIQANTIGYLVEQLEQDHQIGLAGVNILNEDGSQQRTAKRRFPTPESSFVRLLGLSRWFKDKPQLADFDYGDQTDSDSETEEEKQYVEAISGAFMMVSQNALKQVGGLDEGYFMHCEDLDWCKRFWLHGFKVAYFAASEVTHIKGTSSHRRRYRVNWYLHQGMWRFYRKFYRKHYGLGVSLLVYLGIWLRFALTNLKLIIKNRV